MGYLNFEVCLVVRAFRQDMLRIGLGEQLVFMVNFKMLSSYGGILFDFDTHHSHLFVFILSDAFLILWNILRYENKQPPKIETFFTALIISTSLSKLYIHLRSTLYFPSAMSQLQNTFQVQMLSCKLFDTWYFIF